MYEDPGYGLNNQKEIDKEMNSEDGADAQDGLQDAGLNPIKEDSGDASGLSPVRQTTRNRPPVDYNQLSRGIGNEQGDDKDNDGGDLSLNRSMSKDKKN